MKYVYAFNEGNRTMRSVLGGKGANLAEMTNLNLPVPFGFTITTDACRKYYEDNEILNKEIIAQIEENLLYLEEVTGKKFGDSNNPLLVSVRSGARESMPGMMDSILNIGLNDEVALGFSKTTNNEWFVYDSYRRLIQMYADVVMNFSKNSFEYLFDEYKKSRNISLDKDLSVDDLKFIISKYKDEYKRLAQEEFPIDPKVQLIEAVKAVFRSWNTKRAITYRKLNNIPEWWGTAVNVQQMVYGNKGNNSLTGVAFTRNPVTGDNVLFGEYLVNAQGEDVVAGIRTPCSIDTLKDIMPSCYQEFIKISKILENHYKDMQDMEFTIEDGKLYILQTRSGKRTARAGLKIAVDLVKERKITKEEAILRVKPEDINKLLHPIFDEEELKKKEIIAKGLAASPGAGSGKIYFSASDVKNANQAGIKDIILVRNETSPEDIEGMTLAKGVLTLRGGMTSHAAVVARGMGICCVTGCNDLVVDLDNKTLITKTGNIYHEGDEISIDGITGNVYSGNIGTIPVSINEDFKIFMSWADDIADLEVRCNADNYNDAKMALEFGAKGIGLCRTEHMFFDEERIFNFRKMIVAFSKEERIKALRDILPYQKEDFIKLFRVMNDKSVTIRLLDPPLHEFLPNTDSEIEKLALELNVSFLELKNKILSLKEFNPMMGHRGCRLDVTYPEIAQMQVNAIITAALIVSNEGINVEPEIMIPLTSDINELRFVKNIILEEINKIFEEYGRKVNYKIGTMIEVPRAILIADEIAKEVDFFSFGTNDLTQLTYGFSRDDATKFLNDYYDNNIFVKDPFISIDQKGVGQFLRGAVSLGKNVNSNLKLGICGEHGGDPKSIEFFHSIGLDYVSCSPYRVPVARVAVALAKLKENKNEII